MMNLKLPTYDNCLQRSPKFRLEQIITNNSETTRINLPLDSTATMTPKMLFKSINQSINLCLFIVDCHLNTKQKQKNTK